MVKEYAPAPYRVCLLRNGEYAKTLHRCQTIETIYLNYHKLKKANNVLFPKKLINTGTIKPVKYTIAVTKITEEGDTQRILRNEYGKLYTEPFLKDWTILASDDYELEEHFWVFGFPSKGGKRPDISEIVKRLLIGAYAKNMTKQIIIVHNKLLIYNDQEFNMVICKNESDCQRLHHALEKIAKKQKIKSLLFMGTSSKVMVGRMYDLIVEKTKWKIQKVRRLSTRY